MNRLIQLPAVLLLATAGVSSSSCGQPRVRCFTGIGSFAAKYELKEGAGPCAELTGDLLGISTYNQPLPDGTPDLTKADIAIGTYRLGALADRAAAEGIVDDAEDHARNARGDFATMEPNDDDVCSVPELTPAHLSFPELPAIPPDPEVEDDEGAPAEPATDATYAWSDVDFYVVTETRGQQMRGQLDYTENGCTATYEVTAVYPAIDCTGDDGGPDDRWCGAEPTEFNGGAGSGIQPQFPTVCDPDLLLCVLQLGKFPRLAE